MTVEILSPEALLFKGEVTAVNVPGVKGAFVILDHHSYYFNAYSGRGNPF